MNCCIDILKVGVDDCFSFLSLYRDYHGVDHEETHAWYVCVSS